MLSKLKMCGMWLKIAGIALIGLCAIPVRADFQGSTHMTEFEGDLIGYSKTSDTGPIARLQQRIDQGQIKLEHHPAYGYLLSILDELKAPRSSQMLVFSKTSFQRERISPDHPRAIYFGDDVYVGFIPGAPIIEITSVDPQLGAVFYTLEQTKTGKPRFVRTDQCLECHASSKTMGVPGHVVRSFQTDASGQVDLTTGVSQVNHRTPFNERWGGWYVTGTHGDQTHRGNKVGESTNSSGNVTNLCGFFKTQPYPAGDSDIVALMILEHQTHMHNFITRLNYGARESLSKYGHVKYMTSAIEAFLKYLLFTEEAALAAPIEGTASFARDFSAKGQRDKQGRSLRDLDLKTRLFKYPCSYLIYSEAFDALPGPLKDRIYAGLGRILAGEDESEDFQAIPSETRRAIREILIDTKPEVRAPWQTASN